MDWTFTIGIAAMAHLIINSTPGIHLKRLIGLKEEDIGDNKIKDFFIELTYCNLCFGFWFILAFTLNPIQAAIGAVISEAIRRYV